MKKTYQMPQMAVIELPEAIMEPALSYQINDGGEGESITIGDGDDLDADIVLSPRPGTWDQ